MLSSKKNQQQELLEKIRLQEEQIRDLETLNKVLESISSSVQEKDTLRRIVEETLRLCNADQGSNDDTGKHVNRFRAGSGFTIEPLQWMAIRLSYTFNKVTSDNEADEYDEHRGLIQLTLTPSQPYRSID